MNSEDLAKIEKTINKKGEVLINLSDLKKLVDEREDFKNDVGLIVGLIRRLLTQLGILTPEGEIQFKVSRLVRAMSSALLNSGAAEKEFSYLGDLGGIILKYGNKPVDKEV